MDPHLVHTKAFFFMRNNHPSNPKRAEAENITNGRDIFKGVVGFPLKEKIIKTENNIPIKDGAASKNPTDLINPENFGILVFIITSSSLHAWQSILMILSFMGPLLFCMGNVVKCISRQGRII